MTKNDHPYGWTIYAVSQNGPAPICRDPDVVREYSPDEEYVLLKKPDYHDLESPGDANLYPEDKIGAISKTSFAASAIPTACEYDAEDETLYWNGEDMGLSRFDLQSGGTRLCAIDSRNPYKFNSLAITCADIDSPQTVCIDPAESYAFETH